MFVVRILPWTRFFVMFTSLVPCSLQLDWQRSNESSMKFIQGKRVIERERKIILKAAK